MSVRVCVCVRVCYLNCGYRYFQNLPFDYTLAISLECGQTLRNEVVSCPDLASSPGPSQILSRSRGENWEKAWEQNYVTDRKWWTHAQTVWV